ENKENVEVDDCDDETDIELDENDVYIDKSRIENFMTINEVSGINNDSLSQL
ncbi:hypothetical protein Tco_0592072, partial [Tanacetum coccineum]